MLDEIKKSLDRLSHEKLSEIHDYIVSRLGDGQATDALRFIKGSRMRWRIATIILLLLWLCTLVAFLK